MSDNFLGLFPDDEPTVSLSPGQTLFEKGEAAKTLYVVKTGEVQIGDGNQIFEAVGPGGIVGEMALVDGAARSATVRAVAPTTLIPVDERRFLFMIQQTPYFAIRVMRVMSHRLRAMNVRSAITDDVTDPSGASPRLRG